MQKKPDFGYDPTAEREAPVHNDTKFTQSSKETLATFGTSLGDLVVDKRRLSVGPDASTMTPVSKTRKTRKQIAEEEALAAFGGASMDGLEFQQRRLSYGYKGKKEEEAEK